MTLNMMGPCCLNPLLSAHEAMEGLFLFDAMPLTPLGTKVLVHLKLTRCKSWGYHAAKAWYLSHAANHYRCIQVIMRDTGGKCIANTFFFQHHALPIPHITATDCFLQATERLADAIAGVQEAPPNKLAAIMLLQALLLGKELPPEPVKAQVAPNPVTMPVEETLPEKDPPVIMWDPTNDTTTNPQQEMRKSTPLAPQDALLNPTWIKDNHNTLSISPPQQYPPTYPQPVLMPLTHRSDHANPIAGPDCSHDQLHHWGQTHAVGHQPRVCPTSRHRLCVRGTPACH